MSPEAGKRLNVRLPCPVFVSFALSCSCDPHGLAAAVGHPPFNVSRLSQVPVRTEPRTGKDFKRYPWF